MAISSMTGFARVQVHVPLGGEEQLSYTLTVKTVNHRFLDLQFRLPSGLEAQEMELRRVLKENLIRGHVDLTLSVDRASQAKAGYNRDLISGYLAAFDAARREHGAAVALDDKSLDAQVDEEGTVAFTLAEQAV